MLRKSLCVLAFGAAVVAAAPAAACCGCASTCAPVSIHSYHRERIYRAYPQPIYVVNQGPVYSGPNIIALPRLGDEDIGPAVYPYIGHGYYRHSYRWRDGLLYPPAPRRQGAYTGRVYR